MTVIFKAKTNEGHVIKVLSELLQNVIKTACFEVHSKGVRMCMMDSRCRILVHVDLDSINFNIYDFCPPGKDKLFLGINLSHFYKMLKSIKKKDALMLYIDDDDPDELHIVVYPKENNRISEARMHIQVIQNLEPQIPNGYRNPIIVPSGDYQRTLKDMNNIGNTITVHMKKYSLLIECSAGGIYSRNVLFGEINDDSDEYYSDIFDMEQFIRILKIAGLSKNLQIFGGGQYIPLRITSKVGDLGTISIYIKSKSQIREECMKE